MSGTGIRSNPSTDRGSVCGGSLYIVCNQMAMVQI
jgi:hypothetical protein